MNNMELSLVLFTVLSQIAVGMTIMMALRQWRVSEGPVSSSFVNEWMIAGIVVVASVIISHFHLGHPFSSPRAMLHISTSWLSREAVGGLIFVGFLWAAFVALKKEMNAKWVLIKVTAFTGLIFIVISGNVYSPPSFPALNNGVPILFYLLTAFTLGAAFSSYFAGEDKQSLLAGILLVSLILGCVVNLVLPSIWLSGGRVMGMTGANYYGSGLYWLRLIIEFGLGLAVVGATRRIPAWLPVILLAGELLGRIMIFTHIAHTASNLGGIY